MKLIIKIAKNELRNLFYSPVAWFTIVVFFVMFGYFYSSGMYSLAKGINMGERNPMFEMMHTYWPYQDTFTNVIFTTIFISTLSYLYLYVPLLTMGTVSREFSGGTAKLLYSSPVKLRQIVLGKYLALMVFNLVYVLIIGIFMIQGFIDLRALDYGQILSSAFGIYLLLCGFTAIGFFMSSLTSYQIISAIASFTILFVLSKIGGLWQDHKFVKDITWFLSINNRTGWLVKGLIRSKDVIYYLVIIYLFLGFTLIKLRATREIKPWYIKTARYLMVMLSGLLVGYLSTRPRLAVYVDTTYRKTNTILPVTRETFAKLDDELEVTLYVNLFDKTNNPLSVFPTQVNEFFLDLWECYVRFKPGIRFRYEYYYHPMSGDSSMYREFPGKTLKQISGIISRGMQLDSAMFRSPEEISKEIDLKPENYKSVMQLTYKGRKTFLRFLPNMGADLDEGSTEPQFNAAFERLLGTKIPRLAFVTGELERNIDKKGEREYWQQTSLVNFGFDIDTLNLATQGIAPDITTLVLADPKMDLSPAVTAKIRNYLGSGGNMLLLGEPRKQHVLNPLLQQLGIQLMPGQLVQPSENEMPDKIITYQTPTYFNLADASFFRFLKNIWTKEKTYFEDFARMNIVGAVPVSVTGDSGFVITPLVMTKPWTKPAPKQLWLKPGKLVTDSAAPIFSPEQGDIKQDSFITAMQLTRQLKDKEQRIMICGDADFINNLNGSGPSMILYSWLCNNRFPVFTHLKHSRNDRVLVSTRWISIEKILYAWIIPGVLLLLGTILLIRRNRK